MALPSCNVRHIKRLRSVERMRVGMLTMRVACDQVPGEMFKLAMAAKRRGMGVVGSTQNILDFIAAKLSTALEQPYPDKCALPCALAGFIGPSGRVLPPALLQPVSRHGSTVCQNSGNCSDISGFHNPVHVHRLQFILGTEAGMITAITQRVETMLKESGRGDVEVEIVFPVSPDAISTDAQSTSAAEPLTLPNGLTIIPGAASGTLRLQCCDRPLNATVWHCYAHYDGAAVLLPTCSLLVTVTEICGV